MRGWLWGKNQVRLKPFGVDKGYMSRMARRDGLKASCWNKRCCGENRGQVQR